MREFPVNIEVYTFCYNEALIIPEVIKYWNKYATHVVVYDNHSTDNSVELLSKYDWIEIREYDSNNKYDPDLIQSMKESIYKESTADYVMVCDLDEVILYNDSLMDVLKLQKDASIDVFVSEYYNLLFRLSKFTTSDEILMQNYDNAVCIKNDNFKKAILFKPSVELTLRYYSQEYTTNSTYNTAELPILHLKLITSQYLKERLILLENRITPTANKDIALFYGKTSINAGILYNLYKLQVMQSVNNKMTKCTISKASTIRYNCLMLAMKNANGYHRIEWIDFDREDNSTIENKSCVIVIPVYKSELSSNEILSVKKGIEILGSTYHICLVGPASLDYSYYELTFNFKFDIQKCNDAFFKSMTSYSYLCESAEFYKAFDDYKYMLIYLPDGWIFENRLDYFIEMGYDYIGSPWKAGEFESKKESVGNGGVSLRKISVFEDLCSRLVERDFKNKWVDLEDLFFCKHVYGFVKKFNIAPANIARLFCITAYPAYFTNFGKNMPMCAHAWYRTLEDREFWKNYIPKNLKEQVRIEEEKKRNEEEQKKAEYEKFKEEIKARVEAKKLKEQQKEYTKNEDKIEIIEIGKNELEIEIKKETRDMNIGYFNAGYKHTRTSSIDTLIEKKKENIVKKIVSEAININDLLKNSTIKKIDYTKTSTRMIEFDKAYNQFILDITTNTNDLSGKLYNNEQAIISLTSWKARIKYVGKTIYSLLVQCPNFHIVLVLSEEEFPKKELELPNDLKQLLANKLIEILWVYKNYKAFKKVIFTMDRYRDIPVISADDDCIYRFNYALILYELWETHKNSIICNAIGNNGKFKWGNGPYTLYPPYCFNQYGINLLNDEILSTNNDDAYYGVLLTKLNIPIMEMKRRNIIIFHDEITALGTNRTREAVQNNFNIIDINTNFIKNKSMNLIGNSCVSSYIVKNHIKQEFLNPFCWNIIEYESMYNLVKYYDSINFLNYEINLDPKTKNTYIITIDNKVSIRYIHYKNDNKTKGIVVKSNNVYSNNIKQYVIDKYESRVKRMIEHNDQPIFLIAAGYNLEYYYTEEQLQNIINLQSKYKIIISYDKCNIKSTNNVIVLNHNFRMNVEGVHDKLASYLWNKILNNIYMEKIHFSEILLLIKANKVQDFKDWIDWHLNKLKFDHLVVFDNESYVNIKDICDGDSRIEYHYVKGFPDLYKIYNQYINNESKSLWVFPIDDDEYLWMKNFDNVNDMLKYYLNKWTNMHKLSIRWKNMFPNDALASREDTSLMEFCKNSNETWAQLFDGANKPVKTFINTSEQVLYDVKTGQTHIPISINTLEMSYLCNGERMKGNHYTGPNTDDDLKLLHYQYKSKDEWIWKCLNRRRVSMIDKVGYNSKRVDIYKKMI